MGVTRSLWPAVGLTARACLAALLATSAACPAGAGDAGGRGLAESDLFQSARRLEALDDFDEAAATEVGPRLWPDLPENRHAFCIISHATRSMRHYATATADNHAAYARRHGYAYGHYEGPLDTRRFRDPGKSEPVRRYGLYWQSFAAIEDALAHRDESGQPICANVMWVDADVVFTAPDVSIEQMLEQEGVGADTLASGRLAAVVSRQEWHWHTHVNSGALIVHNGWRGRDFVAEVIARFQTHKDVGCPEQTAIEDFAFDTDARTRQDRVPRAWAAARQRLHPDILALRQRAMNSFHGYPADDRDPVAMRSYAWHDGDFAAHFTGPKGEGEAAERLEILRALAGRARD